MKEGIIGENPFTKELSDHISFLIPQDCLLSHMSILYERGDN